MNKQSYEELEPRPEVFTTSVFHPLVANKAGVPPFDQYVSIWSVFQCFLQTVLLCPRDLWS